MFAVVAFSLRQVDQSSSSSSDCFEDDETFPNFFDSPRDIEVGCEMGSLLASTNLAMMISVRRARADPTTEGKPLSSLYRISSIMKDTFDIKSQTVNFESQCG